MSKNMFYIKEEDQELFNNFSEIFKDYLHNSVRYIDRDTSYSEELLDKFAVVFFVLFTRTRGDYYRNIVNAIVDICNGMERGEIEEKYKASKYVLSHTIYVGEDHNSVFFKGLDNFIDGIYDSDGSIFNIDLCSWEFPYLIFRMYLGNFDTRHFHCTINDFIHDRNKERWAHKKPILKKVVYDFLSYFGYGTKSDLEYMTEEYKATKERINYLNNQLSTEKSKLNELESKIRRMQNRAG